MLPYSNVMAIFSRENNVLFLPEKMSSFAKKLVWYFISVYIINAIVSSLTVLQSVI